jgi:hypothetical protein
MASDVPDSKAQDKTTESSQSSSSLTDYLPSWDTVKSATTVGLAMLPGVGPIAAAGYAAYNYLSGDSDKAGDKPIETVGSNAERAGQKILEEITPKPPRSTDSNAGPGFEIPFAPPKPIKEQPEQLQTDRTADLVGKQSGDSYGSIAVKPLEPKKEDSGVIREAVKTVTDAIKSIEIPRLPELAPVPDAAPQKAVSPPRDGEGQIIFKGATAGAEGKVGIVEATIEKVEGRGPNGSQRPVPEVPPKKEEQPVKVELVAQPQPNPIKKEEQPVKVENVTQPQPDPVKKEEQPVKVENVAQPQPDPAKKESNVPAPVGSSDNRTEPHGGVAVPPSVPDKAKDEPKPGGGSSRPGSGDNDSGQGGGGGSNNGRPPAVKVESPPPAGPADKAPTTTGAPLPPAKPADPARPAEPGRSTDNNGGGSVETGRKDAPPSELPGALPPVSSKDVAPTGGGLGGLKVISNDSNNQGTNGTVRGDSAVVPSGPSPGLVRRPADNPGASTPDVMVAKPASPAPAAPRTDLGESRTKPADSPSKVGTEGGTTAALALKGMEGGVKAVDSPPSPAPSNHRGSGSSELPLVITNNGTPAAPKPVPDAVKPGQDTPGGILGRATSVPAGAAVPLVIENQSAHTGEKGSTVRPRDPGAASPTSGDGNAAVKVPGTTGNTSNPSIPGTTGTRTVDGAPRGGSGDLARTPGPDAGTPPPGMPKVVRSDSDRGATVGTEVGLVRKPDTATPITMPTGTVTDANGRTLPPARDGQTQTPAGTLPAGPKHPGDAAVSDSSTAIGKLPRAISDAATATGGDAVRIQSGQRSDATPRALGPDGNVATRAADGLSRSVLPTDVTGNATASNAPGTVAGDRGVRQPSSLDTTAGADRAARPSVVIDTAAGADRAGARTPSQAVGLERTADGTIVAGTRTAGEQGKSTADASRTNQLIQERTVQGDHQQVTGKLVDSPMKSHEITQINHAIDRIFQQRPELRQAERDIVIREIIKHLTQEGILPAGTIALSPKALEVIKILLDQKLNPQANQSGTPQMVTGQPLAHSMKDLSTSGRTGHPAVPGADSASGSQRVQPAGQGQPVQAGTTVKVTEHASGHSTHQSSPAGDASKSQHSAGVTRPGEAIVKDGTRRTGETTGVTVRTETPTHRQPDGFTSRTDAAGGYNGSHGNTAGTRFEPDRVRGDAIRDHQPADRTHPIKPVHDDPLAGGRRIGSVQPEHAGHRTHAGADRDPSGSAWSSDRPGADRREIIDKESDARPQGRRGDQGDRGFDPWIATAVASLGGIARGGDRKTEPDKQQPQADATRTDKRVKYIVQPGETLESIAQKLLGDKRFATLLLTINRSLINFKFAGLVRVPDLRPGQMILLPTVGEVAIHRKTFFGTGPTTGGFTGRQSTIAMGASPNDHSEQPGGHAEELLFVPPALEIVDGSAAGSQGAAPVGQASGAPIGQLLYKIRFAGNKPSIPAAALKSASGLPARRKYTVRLRDTIRSIALRDPLMQDANLWPLIAGINGLSTETDIAGTPLVQLRRGQVIELPDPVEIEQFKLLSRFAGISAQPHGALGDLSVLPGNAQPKAPFGQLPVLPDNLQPAGAPGEPPPFAGSAPAKDAFGRLPATPGTPPRRPSAPIELPVVGATAEPSQPPASTPVPEPMPAEVEARMFIEKLAANCRIVSADVPAEASIFSIKLQTQATGLWRTIASYDCRLDRATRHVYRPDGSRDYFDMDLPVSVVKEMAWEDFRRNWQVYCIAFECACQSALGDKAV